MPEDDDIWSGYMAKWKEPAHEAPAKPAAPAWKPQPYQPFDFSKYLLKSRGGHDSIGTSAPASRDKYWWEADAQPKAAAPKQAAAWWEQMTYDMPENASSTPTPAPKKYTPAKLAPYVPRSTYTKPYTPAVKYEPTPLKQYWWQK